MTAISPLIGPGTVDIPPALRSLAAYTASLAHKTNHSFVPNCEFDEFHHPRYTIYSVSTQYLHYLLSIYTLFMLYISIGI